jgi:hypothetical protein
MSFEEINFKDDKSCEINSSQSHLQTSLNIFFNIITTLSNATPKHK